MGCIVMAQSCEVYTMTSPRWHVPPASRQMLVTFPSSLGTTHYTEDWVVHSRRPHNLPRLKTLTKSRSVVTASRGNGPAVLRHELGHSIIGVGEEYDGGEAYEGVNAANSTSSVPWTQWYTDPSTEPKIQRSNMPIQAYPWTLLNTSQSWSQNFTSAGTYDTHLLQFSVSGMNASSDLRVEVDGKDVGWEVNPLYGLDQYIYNMKRDEALTPGEHEVSFTLLNKEIEGSAQLCNLEVLEYGDE